MRFRLGLAQSSYPTDGDVLTQVEAHAARAQQAQVRLLAFPENLMSPRPLEAAELRALAEPLDGPFVQALARTACQHELWIAFTFSETHPKDPANEPPYNTAVVVDDQGLVRGRYRKCHLYDAHQVRESDRMTAGDALCDALETPFCALGLGICYDLRFPEVARHAATAGCNLVLFPACWYAGPHKVLHWETLLRARAIENECFVAGICHAGTSLVERSMAVDPWGEVLPAEAFSIDGQPGDTLFVTEIDTNAVIQAREAMPLLTHRRPELY